MYKFNNIFSVVLCLLLLGNLFFSPEQLQACEDPTGAPLPETHLYFIENKGQLPPQVHYTVEMNMARFYLEEGRMRYWLMNPADIEAIHESHHAGTPLNDLTLNCHAININFLGANANAETHATCLADRYYNYYIGNDPSKWASHVGLFGEAGYNNLYDGIAMRLYGTDGSMKYDFIVQPNADPNQIRLQYEGADQVSLNNGNLQVNTSVNVITEQQPYAYQIIDGQTVPVQCWFALDGTTVSFVFPSGYNPDNELIIDPFVEFSTYTGSTTDNWGFTATYDNDGHLYAGGAVFFGNGYPITTGAFQIDFAGGEALSYGPTDIGITKYTPDGSNLVYSTYIGGSLANEIPQSLIVTPTDELVIYGSTGSADYPVTAGALDLTFNGGTAMTVNSISFNTGTDAVVTKLNPDGTALIGSTYLGGLGNDGMLFPFSPLKHNYADEGRGEVMLDQQGHIYLATSTNSPDYPATENAFNFMPMGGQDACIVKLSPDLTELIWGAYLGGSGDDAAFSLKVDNQGTVYVAGGTSSSDFMTTAGTIHPNYNGGSVDGFVAKISSDGNTLIASTYLGTNGYDQTYFLDLDGDANYVYAMGQTDGDYPIIGDAYSNPNSGLFIHKMNNNLTNTLFSTVIGNGNGFPNVSPTAFQVDVCNQIYISGWGGSLSGAAGSGTSGMPITPDAYQNTTDNNDFYFCILGDDGNFLSYATYFGAAGGTGEHVDGGTSRFDKKGIVYQAVCAGCGASSMFPTTPGAWSNTNNSSNCNLGSIKFNFEVAPVTADFSVPPAGCPPFAANFTNFSTNAENYIWTIEGQTFTTEDVDYIFDEAGQYEITLVAAKPGTCNGSDTLTQSITILSPSNANAEPADFCIGGAPAMLTGSPAGGTWSGEGITNAATGLFSPAGLAAGTYTVSYAITNPIDPGCNVVVSTTVTVHQQPTITPVSPPTFTGNGDEFVFEVVVTGDDSNYSLGGDFSGTANNGETLQLVGYGVGQTFSLSATGNTYGCSTALLIESPVCSPEAGLMPNTQQMVCSNESVSATTSGAVLENGQLLYYAVHTTPDNTLGQLLGVNDNGTFLFGDLSGAFYNTQYYLSAVVSYPDDNGQPLWGDACTRIADGTPIVFLQPLTALVDEYCDWMTGIFYVAIYPQGGLPSYDPNEMYYLSGDANMALLPNNSANFSFEEGSGITSYAVFINDMRSCNNQFANTFVCTKTPIELVRFDGQVQEAGNLLQWTTGSETENDYFTLLRSKDGLAFEPIAQLDAVGNSIATQNYAYLDKTASVGVTYYRLQWTDMNGNNSQSSTISLTRHAATGWNGISISPIPAQDFADISFEALSGNTSIVLYDVSGRIVQQKQINIATNGTYTYRADLNGINAGLYLLRVENGTQSYVSKLVVK